MRAGNAQGAQQGATVGGDDRRLAGGIHLAKQQGIDAAQHFDEVLETVSCAGVAVRLESQHQAAAGEGAARCGQRCRHFRRMMAVVVDQSEAAASRADDLAIALEASTDAAKFSQSLDDGGITDAYFRRHRNRCQRVEHVVPARQVERDGQAADAAIGPHAGKAHGAAVGHHLFGAEVGLGIDAVGDDLLRHAGNDLPHVAVVAADHGNAIEGQAVEEIDKGLLQPAEIMAIGFHVIGIDVGDYRQHR